MVTSHEDYAHFWWHLAEFFVEWEMFHTIFVEKIQTHAFFSIIFPGKRAVYKDKWKNIVNPDRPQMTV